MVATVQNGLNIITLTDPGLINASLTIGSSEGNIRVIRFDETSFRIFGEGIISFTAIGPLPPSTNPPPV